MVLAKKYVANAGRQWYGEVATESQGQSQTTGWRRFQEHNRHGNHLSAKHQGWANRMVGEALYRQTLMIMREMGSDPNDRKINSRKWAEGECGAKIGETSKPAERYR